LSFIFAISSFLINKEQNQLPKINYKFIRTSNSNIQYLLYLLLLFLLFQIWICYSYLPTTPDTLSNKLVKIYAYLEHGKLVPNPNYDGGLLFISPLNTAATWLIFILHDLNLNVILFFSLFNWIVIAIASYLICRKLNISKTPSFISTFYIISTDIILINSTSDGDDLIAASSFILFLFSIIYWLEDKSKFSSCLIGLTLGIHLGIKPFIVMYYPIVILGLILFIYYYNYSVYLNFIKQYFIHSIIIMIFFFTMMIGVFNENYHTRGNPLSFSKVLNSLRNSPFDSKTAGINLMSQNLELFLTPFLNPTGMGNRESLANKTNNFGKKLVSYFFNVSQDEINLKYSAHQNMTTITSSLHYDHSATFNFLPHILLIFFIYNILHRRFNIPIILGISFIFADIGYCLAYKYIAGVMRYWMILFVITAPLIGYTLDTINKRQLISRAILIIFTLTLFYNIFTSFFGLFNNYYRSISAILTNTNSEVYFNSINSDLISILKSLKKANIVYIHNFPIGIIQKIGHPTKFISKYIQSNEYSNILIFYNTPLSIIDYSTGFKFINFETEKIDDSCYGYKNSLWGADIYIDKLNTDKCYIFFTFTNPKKQKDNSFETFGSFSLNKIKNKKDYQIEIYYTNKEKGMIKLLYTINQLDDNDIYFKIDTNYDLLKFILINKKTKNSYTTFYPIK
jgi:hypothetical protein